MDIEAFKMMEKYIQTDQLLHVLCQVIARANRTYVASKADDSHTNLYFDPLSVRIIGRWFSLGHRNFLLGLNLENLVFELLDDSMNTLISIYTTGKNYEKVEKDVSLAIESQGFLLDNFHDPMHYDIPDYGFGTKKFDLPDQKGLDQWINFRSLANEAVAMFSGLLRLKPDARIWPHHFDTGMYCQVNEKLGLGFGLAMKDSMVGEPYFYLSGYSSSEKIEYNDVKDIGSGEWILTDDWKGAVLRLSELSAKKTENLKLLNEFINKVAKWYLI